MDRYYSILGIPSNSSKEAIKSAYHAKMKALHPDKMHGTPLEDTANFFAAEINEAYNNLMSRFMNNDSSSSNINKPVFLEEDIYIDTYGCLRYTLSNDLNVITNEIYNRFKCSLSVSPSQIQWNLNPALSQNVKKIMSKHDMDYSVTSFWERSIECVVINKKAGSNWYTACYEIISQSKKQTSASNTYYNSNQYTSYSKEKIPFWKFVKVVIAIVIFTITFHQCNNQQPARTRLQTAPTRTVHIFATVVSCEWVNIRHTPSSANDSNIIEAIRVNTRVEILERTYNGWVKIRYDKDKIGYVHSNFLSR